MKRAMLLVYLLVPILSVAQSDSILSGMYSWKTPGPPGIGVRVATTPLFEGKTRDMEWLQMNAASLKTTMHNYMLQVPDNEEFLFLIKSGKLTITIKDSTWQLAPASVALLLPGEVYSLRNPENETCHFYMLKYRSKLPADLARGNKAGGSIVKDIGKQTFIPQERGGRVNYFERGTAMCKRFEMHTTTLKEGLISHAPHTHRAEEIVLVIDNKTEMVIGDKTHPGGPGDVYYLGSNVLHGIKNIGKGTVTYFAFQFE
jgi:(S)-ureidoglycine aminohydrolase